MTKIINGQQRRLRYSRFVHIVVVAECVQCSEHCAFILIHLSSVRGGTSGESRCVVTVLTRVDVNKNCWLLLPLTRVVCSFYSLPTPQQIINYNEVLRFDVPIWPFRVICFFFSLPFLFYRLATANLPKARTNEQFPTLSEPFA